MRCLYVSRFFDTLEDWQDIKRFDIADRLAADMRKHTHLEAP